MRHAAVFVAGFALALGVAERAGAPAPSRPALGVIGGSAGNGVVRIDPRTLAALPGSPRAELGEFHDAWGFSPDGSRAAFGISAPGKRGRVAVRVLDAGTLAVRGEIEAGSAAQALGWVGPDRIAALTIPSFRGVPGRGMQRIPGELILGDPAGGPALARRTVDAGDRCPPATALTDAGFAAVGAGRRPKLTRVDAAGTYATARLPAWPRGSCAGLAADRTGKRLAAVAAGAPLAEIAARTLSVRVHGLRAAPRTRACERRCLTRRGVVWAGGGRVVTFGTDEIGRGRRLVAAGARLVDLAARSVRVLDRRAGGARAAPGGVLTYGRGVRAFSPAGAARWTALRGRRVDGLQVAGGRAYAAAGRRVHVLDARTGRRLGPPRRVPLEGILLLDPVTRSAVAPVPGRPGP